MVGNMVVGLSITLLDWCVFLGLVIGCSDLLLSVAISLVLLLLTDMGLWADGLCLPFANCLLCTAGLLLLFSVRVPAVDFG